MMLDHGDGHDVENSAGVDVLNVRTLATCPTGFRRLGLTSEKMFKLRSFEHY